MGAGAKGSKGACFWGAVCTGADAPLRLSPEKISKVCWAWGVTVAWGTGAGWLGAKLFMNPKAFY